MLSKARCRPEVDDEPVTPKGDSEGRTIYGLDMYPRLRVRIEEDEVSLDKELVGIVHNTDREHDLKVTRAHLNLLDYPYLVLKM